MARTYRNRNYRVFGGCSRDEVYNRYLKFRESNGEDNWLVKCFYRDWLLYGTEAKNYKYRNKGYFNRAHRVGRRSSRDQLRPHLIEDDFDDSEYRIKLKGVWWDIY